MNETLGPADHVHDCTGPDMTCPCGYKFTVARFCVTIDVYDNLTKTQLVNEGGNVEQAHDVNTMLSRAADAVLREARLK